MAKPKRTPKIAASKRRIEPTSALDLAQAFEALRRLLADVGELDAEDVLDRVEAAVRYGEERCPGQRRTHREALAAMARIATDAPDKRGAPLNRETRIYPRLVHIVERNREQGQDDETIAIMLAWGWVRTYGSPAAHAHALVYEAAKLAELADEDAGTFVRNVHRALGYPRTDSLTNATSKRRSRAHAAKVKRRRAA